MKLKKTTIGGIAATLLFAAGCGSSGGGTATGGSGEAAGSGEGGSGGKATGGSGGSATGGSGTGGATGGTAGGAGGAAGGSGGVAGGAGGSGGVAGEAGGSGGTAGGSGGTAGGSGGTAGGAGGGAGVGGSGGTVINIPPALAVPAGATLALHYQGSGVQIYTCTSSGGAGGAAGSGADAGAITYSWVLKGPDAKLYDVTTGAQVGTHGIGPEWTSSDGSVVNGTKVEQVNSTVTGAIPWLLLRASSTTGPGVFSNVTYVQRLNTSGGAAPATGCDSSTSGMDTRVSYTADYYFYTGGGVAAWLTPPADLPTAIAVPSGSTLAIHDHGVGTQIYTCTASGGAGGAAGSAGDAGAINYSWVLKGPNAILSDDTFTQVGMHGVGPTWTSSDGSMISGAKVAQANATAAGAIPWLLLKATSTGTAGVFATITSVQRLNTAGGVAPTTGCGAGTVNTDTSVAYSADYYFYSGGSAGAGGTGG
jgi:hypothetical protein